MKIYISITALFIYSIISAQKIWSFNDCLSYAKENNLQVLASQLKEKVQESEYKIAKKNKLPDVAGSVGNSMIFNRSLNKKYDYQYRSIYNNTLGLSSSVLLYNHGQLKITEEKNNLLYEQNKLLTEKMKNDISLQLMDYYLTVLLNKELLIVDKNSLDNNQQQVDRNQKLYNAGSIPLSTLYESKANLSNAKKKYETSLITVDRSKLNLAMLLQKDYEGFEIESVIVPNNITMPLININEIIEYAYAHQPEIKSSEIGIDAAKKDIDIAKTALYPQISGGYKLGTSYSDIFDKKDRALTDQWFDNHSHTFSVEVSIPIFNKGISKLKIEQAKVRQLIQENDLDQQKLTLKQTIQTAYFDVNSSYQTYLAAKESVESTKISYDFAQKSFAAGKINVYDLNVTRNNYFDALSNMLQAKYSFLFRQKILDFYIGKPLELTSSEVTSTSTPSSTSSMNDVQDKKHEQDKKEEEVPVVEKNELSTTNIPLQAPVIHENVDTTMVPTLNNPVALPDLPQNSTIIVNDKPLQEEKSNLKVHDIQMIQKKPVSEKIEAIMNAPSSIVENVEKSGSEKISDSTNVDIAKTIPEILKPVSTENNNISSSKEVFPTDNLSKREELIRQRRLQLNKGSIDYNIPDREKLIQARRLKLQRRSVD